MAHRKGWLSAVAALALVAAFGLVVVAQDRGAQKDKGGDKDKTSEKDKGGTDKGQSYSGKITKVDAEKRMITLEGTGSGGTKDKADADKARVADKDKGGKSGSAWTFMVERGATVTVDGKKSELRDLRSGQYARVQAGGTGGGGKDKAEADKDKGTRTGNMTATRVEAFTKQPTDTGRDKGVRDKGRERE